MTPDETGVTRTEEFEQLRPLLFAIAYRILGSVSEAEDAVQESWLRYAASPTYPTSARAFLAAVVTRVSINVLRSARSRREEYVGPWFPEPLLTDPYQDPERSAELADSVSMAALLLLERLSPLERAVFVLREVFAFDFPEISSAVGRSEAACRQLAVRARRHMDAGQPRFEAGWREREELAARLSHRTPRATRSSSSTTGSPAAATRFPSPATFRPWPRRQAGHVRPRGSPPCKSTGRSTPSASPQGNNNSQAMAVDDDRAVSQHLHPPSLSSPSRSLVRPGITVRNS